jgi:hypothetical protein
MFIMPKVRHYYTEVPQYPDYIISNAGNVYRKSTWKQISIQKSGNYKYFQITFESKRIKLSLNKLLQELFPAATLPVFRSPKHKRDMRNSLYRKRK